MALVINARLMTAGQPNGVQPPAFPLHIFANYGLLINQQSSAVTASKQSPTERPVAVTTDLRGASSSNAAVDTRTLPFAVLEVINEHLFQLLKAKPQIVDFEKLALELLRVVREVGSAMHRELEVAMDDPSTRLPSSSQSGVVVNCFLKYVNHMPRVSLALSQLSLLVLQPAVRKWDVSCIEMVCRDVAFMLAVRGYPTGSSDSAYQMVLGRGWTVLSKTLCRSDIQESQCVSILKVLNDDDAWMASGTSLFLCGRYCDAVREAACTLLEVKVFRAAFHNALDVLAKILWTRLAHRPPITSSHQVTSRGAPKPLNGLLIVVAMVGVALEPLTPHFRDIQDAIQRINAAASPDSVSLFQWVFLGRGMKIVPIDFTFNAEELLNRAERTHLISTREAALVNALLNVDLLRSIVVFSRCGKGMPPTRLREDETISLFDSAARNLLQLRCLEPSEFTLFVDRGILQDIFLHLLDPLCVDNPTFAGLVTERVAYFTDRAFQLVRRAVDRADGPSFTTPQRIPPVILQHGRTVEHVLRNILLLVPLSQVASNIVLKVILCLAYLLPLKKLYVARTVLPPAVQKTETALVALTTSMTISAAGQLNACDVVNLIDEVKRSATAAREPQSCLSDDRLTLLLRAVSAPNVCQRLPNDRLMSDWFAMLDPVLGRRKHPCPFSLQSAAHACLIAPIINKLAIGLQLVPTYVALFCPLDGVKQRYAPMATDMVRVFAQEVRIVATHLEGLDTRDTVMQAEEGTPSKETATTTSTQPPPPLTPLSGVLLIVQGVFDQVRHLVSESRSHPTKGVVHRRDLYISALLNLLQCSHPLVTSRVCTSVEVLLLDYLADDAALQERTVKFAGDIVQGTSNVSVKKPVGEWLLRVVHEARSRRQKNSIRSRL